MKNIYKDIGPTLDMVEAATLETLGDAAGREMLISTYRGRAAALVRSQEKDPWDDEDTVDRGRG